MCFVPDLLAWKYAYSRSTARTQFESIHLKMIAVYPSTKENVLHFKYAAQVRKILQ